MNKEIQPKTIIELRKELRRAKREHGNYADLTYIDTSLITTFKDLFHFWPSFRGTVSHWDTSNVRNMSGTFKGCRHFDGTLFWDVRKLIDATEMFMNCVRFNQSLPHWKTDRLMLADRMFLNCQQLNKKFEWKINPHCSCVSMFEKTYNLYQDFSKWTIYRKDSMFFRSAMQKAISYHPKC